MLALLALVLAVEGFEVIVLVEFRGVFFSSPEDAPPPPAVETFNPDCLVPTVLLDLKLPRPLFVERFATAAATEFLKFETVERLSSSSSSSPSSIILLRNNALLLLLLLLFEGLFSLSEVISLSLPFSKFSVSIVKSKLPARLIEEGFLERESPP